MLLTLVLALVSNHLFGQAPVITSVTPFPNIWAPGTAITITGTDVYDDPAVTPNCDSIRLRNTLTNQIYSYHPRDTSANTGDPTYLGAFSPNRLFWTIPNNLPCGQYEFILNDDEDCNNSGPSWSPPFTIQIAATATLTYPNGGSYCLNGSNPAAPTITGTAGTFFDLTGNGILANSSTGALILHSGTAGLNNIRFITNPVGALCRDTLDIPIQVDTMRLQTLSYGGTAFCQGPTILNVQAPFDATGGSFSCIPPTPALNAISGDFNLALAPSGGYAITWTPGPSFCENPHTVSIQVDSLVAAVYNYDSVYCVGSALNGLDSISFLPPGGFFQEVGGAGNLVFADSVTGELDLNNTPAAPQYVVQYVVTGGCVSLTRDTFEVRIAANANFTIPNSVCSNADSLTATGFVLGGNFISGNGAIQFFPPSTAGIIDVGSSTIGGPFTIFYFVNDPVCPDTVERHITISPAPMATINYVNSPYCLKESNPIPFFVTGATGGTYSITPTGTIGATDGIVDLLATGPGQYAVHYAVTVSGCSNSIFVDSIRILPMLITAFDLLDTSLCQNSGTHLIQSITSAGAAFSQFSMSNGQYIPFPGAIIGNNSVNTDTLPVGGPFRIHRLVDDGTCKDSLVDYVWILPEEDPTFIYAPSEYCQSDRDPSPLITGDGGGTFIEINSDSLVITDTTGLIDVSASSPGIHTVQYTTGGPCSRRSTFDVLVTRATSPNFGYLENSYCETSRDTVEPILPPNLGPHHFTVSNPTLVLIDSLTGALDIGASDTGSYNVTLFLDSTSGNCITEARVSIEILGYENDSIAFPTPVCRTDSLLQIQYDTSKAGVFFAPSGLVWEDRATGLVAVYATAVDSYQIRYEISGICAEQFTKTLVVENPTDPEFGFPGGETEFCRSDDSTSAVPINPGGQFSWTNFPLEAKGTLLIDSLRGIVDLSGSSPGNYDVTYNTGTTCSGDTTVRILIFPNPAAPRIDLTPNDSICLGQSLLVEAYGSSFFKIRVNGVEKTTQAVLEADSLDSTAIIEVVFITQQLCKDSLDTLVTVLPIPDGIPVVTLPTITGNQDIDFDITTSVDNTSFDWTLSGIGMVSFNITDGSIPPLLVGDFGNILVTPTLANGYEPAQAVFSIVPQAYGCIGDTDIVIIKINPNDLPIFIPEVFTPNDDQKNDRWLIQWNNSVNPNNYRMLLFNRSGGQVESFDHLRDDWDGGSLPDGVYWWQLYEGSTLYKKGAVTIRRR